MLKNNPLRFESIIYPLWRRKLNPLLKLALEPVYQQIYPVHADRQPPRDPQEMARFLVDWDIITDETPGNLAACIASTDAPIEHVAPDGTPPVYEGGLLRVPAQWEPVERVLLSWGRMYPDIWEMHAQMVEAVSEVAVAEVLVPSEMWARGVAVYLARRGYVNAQNLRFLVLRTDDIWIRDYGPIMSVSDDGQRVAVNPTYAVLPQYPQSDDNSMTARWAAHHDVPVRLLELHTEGGNLWSDGNGTLIMSSQIFYSNRYYTRDTLLDYLHTVFDFEKLIITPRLTLEETGHVDLLVKLATDDTVFVSRAESPTTAEIMRRAKRLFQRETNAAGTSYQVVELPTPPLYLNWFLYTIRRAYTNSLTVNGRVLVPTFRIPQDDVALRLYETHMPGFEVIPIDSRIGINGGGAVHCMTKEVPGL
jgi:agmatine deiminase